MSFLNELEPLKQAALADLKTAPHLGALEQTKGTYRGSNGKLTALMKQLGTVTTEDRPTAGKLINRAAVEWETALAERRAALELISAWSQDPADFILPGRRRSVGMLHP